LSNSSRFGRLLFGFCLRNWSIAPEIAASPSDWLEVAVSFVDWRWSQRSAGPNRCQPGSRAAKFSSRHDWVENIPDLPGIRIKVRGSNNSDYRALEAKLVREIPRAERIEGVSPKEQDRIAGQLLLQTVVLDVPISLSSPSMMTST
jgi:hypothetical protein